MAHIIPIVGLTSLIGYYLNKNDNSDKKTDKIIKKTPLRNNIQPFETPNGKYIYSSNFVNESNNEILNKSLDLYNQSQNPAISGVLPPLFNTYGATGNINTFANEDLSNKNLMNVNNINRIIDITKPNEPILESRPMFQNNTPYTGEEKQEDFSIFSTKIPVAQEEVSLLTGQPLEKDHNNMVPFFGSNIRQNVESFTNETILDLHSGNTSTFKHKKEITPLFENQYQNIYGAPVFTTQVEEDRYIPSLYKQGEKPFIEEKISAPISGTYENNIKPQFKDVNELRPGNKPKESYEARTLVGKMGEVRGVQSIFNKNRPDTFYEQGSDRLIVTTGQHIAKKSDENYSTNFKPTSRTDYNLEYYGPAGTSEFLNSVQRIAPIDNSSELNFNSLMQVPKRQNFENDYSRNISGEKRVNDYGKTTINTYETERTSTSDKSHLLNPVSMTRGIKTSFRDIAKSTIKETTLDTDPTRNLKSSFDKGFIETHYSGISDFVARTTNKETIGEDNYKGVIQKEKGMGYLVNKYNAPITGKEIISENSEYQGTAKYSNNPMSHENYLNAEIRNNKQDLLERDRLAGPQNFQISSGKNAFGDIKFTENMQLKETIDTREHLNLMLPNIFPSKMSIGVSDRMRYDDDIEDTIYTDRIDSNIVVSQFNENPYSIYGKK